MLAHESLVAVLRDRASAHGERDALVYCRVPADVSEDETLTYADLDAHARSVAVLLSRHGSPGDRVLVLNQMGTGFAKAFLGCVYAGMIAIPAPTPDGYSRQRDRLAGIARDARATIVLTDSALLDKTMAWAEENDLGLAGLVVDGDLPDPAQWLDPEPAGDFPVFLQYTSGSTGAPKGVVVDHANLLANVELFVRMAKATEETRFGGWLPMYHDFGLIGLLLVPLTLGATTITMSPLAFVKRPQDWLWMMALRKVNLSPAPNFGYELCLQRITDEQLQGIDLSCWTHALNGSEPIRAAAIRRFTERFARHGFARGAMLPGYGLAEATLVVCAGTPGGGHVSMLVDAARLEKGELLPSEKGQRELVSSGVIEPGMLVVDPASRVRLPDGLVGEIWVRGPHVARGYWEKPELNLAVFDATTAEGDGGYLRTGDLGACHEGQIYVTGRLKELLIVRGKNHYPQDLEADARLVHPALARGAGAAFAVELAEESVVLVHECRAHGAPDLADVAVQVREAIAREHGLSLAGVVLVQQGEVPRTTSGKIQRSAARELFLSGTLKVLHADVAPALAAHLRRDGA
jgi:acyl-CoA synthetase (AMP-forming)/AMP-acid ligase II